MLMLNCIGMYRKLQQNSPGYFVLLSIANAWSHKKRFFVVATLFVFGLVGVIAAATHNARAQAKNAAQAFLDRSYPPGTPLAVLGFPGRPLFQIPHPGSFIPGLVPLSSNTAKPLITKTSRSSRVVIRARIGDTVGDFLPSVMTEQFNSCASRTVRVAVVIERICASQGDTWAVLVLDGIRLTDFNGNRLA